MPVPTTREGFEKLRGEIEHLESVEMVKIVKAIALARSEGDLSENAEYHGQRENQGMLHAKIERLKAKLADAYIVEPKDRPNGVIAFGATVVLKDLDADLEETYQLVGPGEEDYSGLVLKILSNSPLAQQLINHKTGEVLEVETPGGRIRYEVLSIE